MSGVPAEVEAYVEEVAERLKEVLGAELVGLYLHGSAVLRDFSDGRPCPSPAATLGAR